MNVNSSSASRATCERLRSLVQDCIAKHMYKGAVFFADKLVTLSESAPADVYLLAQAHYVSKEYRRALTLLNKQALFERDIRFRYLAAKCLAECQDWEECLGLLGADDIPETLKAKEKTVIERSGAEVNMYSVVCVLRGKVYEALENRQRAVKWYRVALKTDPFCYEAYEALMGNHMLTNQEERDLLASIKFKPEDQWLSLLYSTMGKMYEQQDTLEQNLSLLEGGPALPKAPVPLQPSCKQNDQRKDDSGVQSLYLSEPTTRSKTAKAAQQTADGGIPMDSQNVDEEQRLTSGHEAVSTLRLSGNVNVTASRAELLFCKGCTMEAYKLTSQIIRQDPHALECIATHLACMVELGKKNELFKQAHRLVQDYPERGIAWYGVGCYYLCTGQYDCARRYFGKATQLQPNLAQAWVTYGHSYAAQDESDQALAAYRTAARLFPGLHQPVLGMGREYQHMNNLHLAEQMYLQAYNLCKFDPLVCNELGVLNYLKKDYDSAGSWLRKALGILQPARLTIVWQPTIVNLAHTYRKQQQYELAIEMYNQALGLKPHDHGTFTALGFTYHLQSKLELAIENYHKALGFKPEDATTTELLKDALELHCVHCSDNDDPGLM